MNNKRHPFRYTKPTSPKPLVIFKKPHFDINLSEEEIELNERSDRLSETIDDQEYTKFIHNNKKNELDCSESISCENAKNNIIVQQKKIPVNNTKNPNVNISETICNTTIVDESFHGNTSITLNSNKLQIENETSFCVNKGILPSNMLDDKLNNKKITNVIQKNLTLNNLKIVNNANENETAKAIENYQNISELDMVNKKIEKIKKRHSIIHNNSRIINPNPSTDSNILCSENLKRQILTKYEHNQGLSIINSTPENFKEEKTSIHRDLNQNTKNINLCLSNNEKQNTLINQNSDNFNSNLHDIKEQITPTELNNDFMSYINTITDKWFTLKESNTTNIIYVEQLKNQNLKLNKTIQENQTFITELEKQITEKKNENVILKNSNDFIDNTFLDYKNNISDIIKVLNDNLITIQEDKKAVATKYQLLKDKYLKNKNRIISCIQHLKTDFNNLFKLYKIYIYNLFKQNLNIVVEEFIKMQVIGKKFYSSFNFNLILCLKKIKNDFEDLCTINLQLYDIHKITKMNYKRKYKNKYKKLYKRKYKKNKSSISDSDIWDCFKNVK